MNKFCPYPWQADAFIKVDKMLNEDKHILSSVAASVGSGKTALAAYTLGKFIQLHRAEKTIGVFIAPRINLCNQQHKEIANTIQQCFGLNADLGDPTDPGKKDYKIWLVNCEAQNKNYKNEFESLNQQHNIFVVCDKSLWGNNDVEKREQQIRYNHWIHRFNKWEKEGFKFGAIIYDEAHNFDTNVEKMSAEDLKI